MTAMFPSWRRRTWLALLGVALAALVAANAHLVYVAFQSQPECVTGSAGGYQTARPAC